MHLASAVCDHQGQEHAIGSLLGCNPLVLDQSAPHGCHGVATEYLRRTELGNARFVKQCVPETGCLCCTRCRGETLLKLYPVFQGSSLKTVPGALGKLS